MAERYLRLAEPPQWCLQYPTCSACDIELDLTDGYGWTCLSCGAEWGDGAGDGEFGTLPADVTGPVIPNRLAWRVAAPDLDPDERDERARKVLAEEASR